VKKQKTSKNAIDISQFLDDLYEYNDYIYVGDESNKIYSKYKRFLNYLLYALETRHGYELLYKFKIIREDDSDFLFRFFSINEGYYRRQNQIALTDANFTVNWTIVASFTNLNDDLSIQIKKYKDVEPITKEIKEKSDELIFYLINTKIQEVQTENRNEYFNYEVLGNCIWDHITKTFKYDIGIYEDWIESITYESNELIWYITDYNTNVLGV